MLRVAFPHKTDGVGGHVVTATSALGGAALLGLRLVCDPAMLYNGHMAQSDPHLGSRLLLGCDEGGNKPVVEASSSSAIAGEKRGWESESDGESGEEEEEDEDGEDSVVSADAEQPTAKRRRGEDPFLVCGL